MGSIKSDRDLEVWQLAMDLTVLVYRLTKKLPKSEEYGLKSQMRDASVSSPSNIAEGFGRMSRKAYGNHVSIARGSTLEIQTQLELCVKLDLLTREDVADAWQLSDRISQMLSKLITRLRHPDKTSGSTSSTPRQ